MKKIKKLNANKCSNIAGGCDCWCYSIKRKINLIDIGIDHSADDATPIYKTQSSISRISSDGLNNEVILKASTSRIFDTLPAVFEEIGVPIGKAKNEKECKTRCDGDRMGLCMG